MPAAAAWAPSTTSRIKYLADHGELNIRAFYTTIRQPGTPEQVDKVLAEIPTLKPFQGNDYFENIGWGESVYCAGDHAAAASRKSIRSPRT